MNNKGGKLSDPNVKPEGSDLKAAQAEAKAAAAKAKALRPWFKKKRFIVPLALVVVIGISNAMNGGTNDEVASDSSSQTETSGSGESEGTTAEASGSGESEETTAEASVPGIGSAVVAGNFTFTVTALECGISGVGTDSFGQKAQGEYCKINLTVENTGNEADYFSASNQKVLDSEGREFEADTGAMIYLEEGDDVWLGADINPGNSAEVAILYDMPVGVAPVTITLVDGLFGSGVEVSLK
jgi:hypothetical protein